MDANALDTCALLSNEVAQKTQCHIFDENWWVRTRLPEDTNPTACPWKDCWVWQWERGQEGGRSRLGSQLLEAPGLCWISVGFSMQGPGHPKASKCVPGLALPKAPCSSPSTEQIVPCSAELIECRKFLRLPPAPNWEMFRSWRAVSAAPQGRWWCLSQRDPMPGEQLSVVLPCLVWDITPRCVLG